MSEASGYSTRNLGCIVADESEPLVFEAREKALKKRIMLVVPGRLFRDGIERVLRRSDRVVVGQCETLDQVEAVLGDLPAPDRFPDLFVVDIPAPSRATQEFARIRALRAKMPASRWILLSRGADIGYLRDVILSDIEGILPEDSPGEALHLLAELVLLGRAFVPAELAKVLAAGLPPVSDGIPVAAIAPPKPRLVEANDLADDRQIVPAMDQARRWQVSLSDRENEILRCLIAGHPNKLIARELRIAEATVKVHVKALLRKMQVTNRTQAAISALRFLRATKGGACRADGPGDGAAARGAALRRDGLERVDREHDGGDDRNGDHRNGRQIVVPVLLGQ